MQNLQPTPSPANNKTYKLKSSVFFVDDWLHLWILPVIHKLRSCQPKDFILALDSSQLAQLNGDKLEQNINTTKLADSKINILAALKKSFLKTYLLIGLWKLVWALFTWLGAYYFLQISLDFLQGKYSVNLGYTFSACLLLSSVFSSIAIHQLYGQCQKMAIKVRSSLTVCVFRKSLKVFRLKGGAGEVINILSTDVGRLTDSVTNMHFLWSCFVEVIVILAISFVVIGNSAFLALGVVILLLPLQMYLGKKTSQLQAKNTQVTTTRVHLMSEILTAIKLIKFYAWEKPFTKKIKEIRNEEISLVEGTLKLKALNFAIVFAVPVIVALLCLATYRKTGHELTSSIAFTILSVFNTLRYPFLMLPLAVKSYSGSKLSLKRINEFLNLDEVEDLKTLPSSSNGDLAIKIVNSDFSWEESSNTILDEKNIITSKTNSFLTNIDLEIKKGELIAVIGDVGSGKSSLLAAIMGQMNQTSGEKPKIFGKISYVPQEAWLLNIILRENIIFGKKYEELLYKKSIKAAALERDLTLLVAADETEIAERGSNLSGGQKQRVSIARAIYDDGDIVLLDDPLSAVDQNVGRQIFNNCIKEQFSDKAVVFVTHQLQYLSNVDRVVVMKNGQIRKMGSYDELMRSDQEFSDLINTHVVSDKDIEGDEILLEDDAQPQQNLDTQNLAPQEIAQLTTFSENIALNQKTITSIIEKNQLSVVHNMRDNSHDVASQIQRNQLSVYSQVEDIKSAKVSRSPSNVEKKDGALISEDKSTKNMGARDFVLYFREGSGMFYTILICVVFFLVHGIRIGSDFWLKLWIPDTLNTSDAVYLGTYGAFVVAFALGVFVRGLMFAYEASKKAHILHDNMFRSVMRAPMSFFDTTPIGRILSAFSKHQFQVDDTMPDVTMQALQYAPLALGAILIVACVVHWPNAVTVVCLVVVAGFVVYYASPAENKLKQLDATTKPNIFAHLTATLEGLFSIRAYKAQGRFDKINNELLDINNASYYALQEVKTFTAFYLDILTSLIVYSTALFIVVYRGIGDQKTVSADAGLALSNALQMLVFLQWTIKAFGDVQSQISSVGQLVYYANDIDEEAPTQIPENKPTFEWPSKGAIKFNNISLRYHKFGVKVLKNVNLFINAREKIGIVGRTGSGKSTLLISLLRIVEPCEGQILIDGVDISKLGLDDLRKAVAIIPQEPVLFVGSIRYNLDPFGNCTDDEIWHALASVHLKDGLQKLPLQLETLVLENGKNFSLGQRQLFCIARAILSKAKILVLDEATAAIDMATDLLIQNCIKENFSDVTVLTIAHRLNTIIESDKVLVMDGGKALEFDEPIKLLNNPKSSFSDLVQQTGPATAKKLMETARNASEARRTSSKSQMNSTEVQNEQPLLDVFKKPSI